MKPLIVFLSLICCLHALGQDIRKYVYWMDNNYEDRISVEQEDNDISFMLSPSSLDIGLHRFTVVVQGQDNVWGVPLSRYFYYAGPESVDCEYWFDSDCANRISVRNNIGQPLNLSVDTEGLSKGLHTLNIATKAGEEYTSIIKKYFYKTLSEYEDGITGYCCWVDDDVADTIEVAPTMQLDLQNELIDVPQRKFPLFLSDDIKVERYAHEGQIEDIDNIGKYLKLSTVRNSTFHFAYRLANQQWTEETCPVELEDSEVVLAKDFFLNRVNLIAPESRRKISAGVMDLAPGTLCMKSNASVRITVLDAKCDVLDSFEPDAVMNGVKVLIPKKGQYFILVDGEEDSTEQEVMRLVCVTDPLPSPLHVEEAGTLSELLSFCEPTDIDSLSLTGQINGSDFAEMSLLSGMEKLDVFGTRIVADSRLGTKNDTLHTHAFASMPALRELSLPSTLKCVDDGAFSGTGGRLLVVDWSSTMASVRAEAFDSPEEMGNLLVYTPAGTEISYRGNVVADGKAGHIVLTDRMPLFCPKPFTAEAVSYSRVFGKKTVLHEACGWETLVLPFDVQHIVSEERGELAPFNSGGEGACPFWLAELTSAGFVGATSVHANRPYIIAMPNSDDYEEYFNVRGTVTFSAADSEKGVGIEATSGCVVSSGPEFELVPAYEVVQCSDTVYTVNDEEYEGMLPGAVFVSGLRDVLPFEAYARSVVGVVRSPRYYNIGGKGVADGMLRLIGRASEGLSTCSRDGVLYINSPRRQTLGLYSADGRLVRLMHLSEGQNCEYGLEKGIYFIGRMKIAIE